MSRHHAALFKTRRWLAVRRVALDRAGWRCERCGAPGALEVHHRIALERGGDPFALDNLEVLDRGCHIEHHRGDRRRARTPAETAWADLVASMRNVIT